MTKIKLVIKNNNNSFKKLIEFLILIYICSIGIRTGFINSTFSNAIALILIFLLVIYELKTKLLVIDSFLIVFTTFVSFCCLSISWAKNKELAFERCGTLLLLLILYTLLYNYLKRENRADYLIKAFTTSGIIYVIYILFSYGLKNYIKLLLSGIRLGSEVVSGNSNTVGITCCFAAMFCLWVVLYKKVRWMWLGVVLCTFVAFGTGSRKALLGIVIGLSLLTIMRYRGNKRIISIINCLLLIFVLVKILNLPIFSGTMNRFNEFLQTLSGTGKTNSSANIRMELIQIGLTQFTKTPIAGIGIGNSSLITLGYFDGTGGYLHNNYVELMATVGLIGTIAYYMLYFIPLFSLIRMTKENSEEAVLCLCIMIVYLFLQAAVVVYYDKMSYLYIMLFFLIIKKKANKQHTN